MTGDSFKARIPDMTVADLCMRLLGSRTGSGRLLLVWMTDGSRRCHRRELGHGSGSVLEALNRDDSGVRLSSRAQKSIVICTA